MNPPEEPAASFYDAVAPMFDVMTDWEARLATEGPFLRSLLDGAGAARLLDAACGSGGHAVALARWGYQVVGADASPIMIGLARQKASEGGLDIPFAVSDLEALSESVAAFPKYRTMSTGGSRPVGQMQDLPLQFDAVLCLGNSLPHLLAQADLIAALRGMARVLKPGGLFITQNLNYDLRWQTQPRFFAAQGGTVEGQEVLVWRFADYDLAAGRIAFHIALFCKREKTGDWEVQVHTTPQRPLFHADLVSALAEVGFGETRAYGRMALPLEPFNPDKSPDLVVVTHLTGN